MECAKFNENSTHFEFIEFEFEFLIERRRIKHSKNQMKQIKTAIIAECVWIQRRSHFMVKMGKCEIMLGIVNRKWLAFISI